MAKSESPERRARGRPRAWGDTSEQNRIKSLDRAFEVLERLSELSGATLSELAADLDESPATVYRVLFTLEARGVVEFDSEPQTWHIGPRAFVIGARFLRRTALVERARPVLRQLMQATGETANLGVHRDGRVLFVAQAETHEHIRAFFPPGTLSPMHSSGIGKALLSAMPEDQVRAILQREGQERFTPGTLTTRDALMADLRLSRARGFAIDAEERNVGMRCIAAPIFDAMGDVVAGISVSGPVNRMADGKTADLSAHVTEAARDLTARIGGTVPGGHPGQAGI